MVTLTKKTHHHILEGLSHSVLEVSTLQLKHDKKGQEDC